MRNYEVSAEDIRCLRGLVTLDGESFSEILEAVLGVLGASGTQRAMLIANSGALRNMLARSSDTDLRKLASRIGPQKTREVLDIIGQRVKNDDNNDKKT